MHDISHWCGGYNRNTFPFDKNLIFRKIWKIENLLLTLQTEKKSLFYESKKNTRDHCAKQ